MKAHEEEISAAGDEPPKSKQITQLSIGAAATVNGKWTTGHDPR